MTQPIERNTPYELLRACAAVPLTTDGRALPAEELSPGLQLIVEDERDGRLVVVAEGSSPAHTYRYLVTREALTTAITEPDLLPREGQAPTASSNTAGSPD